MDKKPVTRDQVEAVALELGASRTQILKWRQRGIPGDWALRIAAASGTISAADMVAFDQARAPAALAEAAS